MEQICKVRTDEYDGDETGHEWPIHYIVYRAQDDEGVECFDLYEGDGAGNAGMIARSYGRDGNRLVGLCLKLGKVVEWKEGEVPKPLPPYSPPDDEIIF